MINVFEMNPEYMDSRDYFDFDGWDDFIIASNLGNDECSGIHTDYPMYDKLYRYCIDCEDLPNALAEVPDSYPTKTAAIEDYLEISPSPWQVHKIVEILNKPYSACCTNYYDDTERMAELLSVIEGREWTTEMITGCVQREWQEIIYPVDEYSDEFINYIESVYFNTGMEVKICEDTEEEITDPYDADGYFDYIRSDVTYNDDLLIEELAKNIGCKKDDIIFHHWLEITTETWRIA